MPKISGRDVISESTEKSQTRLMIVCSIAIITKAYALPIADIKLLGMDFPESILDVSLLVLVCWFAYSYVVKWSGDLLAYRSWYSEAAIFSTFGTQMKIDGKFIWDSAKVLAQFHNINVANININTFDPEKKRDYENFLSNLNLYSARLEAAGKKFSLISKFGHFYIWIQGFVIPTILVVLALYFVLKYGSFSPPSRY